MKVRNIIVFLFITLKFVGYYLIELKTLAKKRKKNEICKEKANYPAL